jgi:hypothetical protein
MAAINTGRFIAKIIDFLMPKAHNPFGYLFTLWEF